MKITDVEINLLTLRWDNELKGGTYKLIGESAVIPRITTDNGLVSEVFVGDEPYARIKPHHYQSLLRYIVHSFRDILIGEDPFNVEKIWEKMFARTMTTMRHEDVRIGKSYMMQAIGAVDIALWDLMGKSVGEPLYKILGGFKEKIPVVGTIYYPDGDLVEGTKKQVKTVKKSGMNGVKFKVGAVDLKEDVDRVRAAREAGGPNFVIGCDANQAWEPRDAIKFAKMVEEYDISWLEEPVRWHDEKKGLRMVREHTTIPVCAGQGAISLHECKDLIVNDSIDIVNPSPWKIGGVTPWMKVAHTAYAFDTSIYAYMSPGPGLNLMAAVSNGSYVMFNEDRYQIRDRIWESSPKPENGHIDVPRKPGFGIKLIESMVEALKVT